MAHWPYTIYTKLQLHTQLQLQLSKTFFFCDLDDTEHTLFSKMSHDLDAKAHLIKATAGRKPSDWTGIEKNENVARHQMSPPTIQARWGIATRKKTSSMIDSVRLLFPVTLEMSWQEKKRDLQACFGL